MPDNQQHKESHLQLPNRDAAVRRSIFLYNHSINYARMRKHLTIEACWPEEEVEQEEDLLSPEVEDGTIQVEISYLSSMSHVWQGLHLYRGPEEQKRGVLSSRKLGCIR